MTQTLAPVVQLDEITPAWLTQVLTASGALSGGTVTAFECEPVGTGQLADSYRFSLTYDTPGSGPATIVGKFPSADEASRAFAKQSGYYRNEIRFYEELAPTSTVALPKALHAGLAEDETEFVLLMTDLTPARTVDQNVGCTVEEAGLVVEQAAKLHADSWQDARLAEVDWLKGTVGSFAYVTDNFPETLRTFPEIAGDLVPQADLDEAAKLLPYLEAWKAAFSEPRCLWHSDLRADNVLFDVRGGEHPIAVLDWQGLGYGNGVIDIAYFLGTSLVPADRRAAERDLVGRYHAGLVAGGVTGYTAEQCWEDYRVLAVHGLQVGVFGLGAVKRSPRGDEMWRIWIERTAAQTRELDSFTALAER
ncbi:MAG: hypothetical protein JWN17_2034 [Frankiales bacterium]|nr:hypothetical protein [Frankiales bacterium]